MEIARGQREIKWEHFDFEKRIIPPASLVLEQALAMITPEGKIIDGPDIEYPLVVIDAKEPIDLKSLEREYEEQLLYVADRIHIATIRLLSPIHRKHGYHWLSNLAYEISPYVHDPAFLEEAANWAKLNISEHGTIISPWMLYQSKVISSEE